MRQDSEFDQQGRLTSRRYGDVYFSGDGVQETEHVFVNGNDLQARLPAIDGTFVIGETGFGTGLNFLIAMELFVRIAPDHARLIFITTELHPLPIATMAAAHGQLPERLHTAAKELRAALGAAPPRGAQRLTFCGGRVVLHVLHGDATASLSQTCFRADAWFLDGFSPARNPAMWSFALLREVAMHTAADGTIATYTVAGEVRRGLRDAGFAVDKARGFAKKREMLRGLRRPFDEPDHPPRFASKHQPAPRHVQVFGAGIAGATAASAFAKRGATVTVTDPRGVASGASGIRAAIVRPRLWRSANRTPDAEMLAQAFRYTSGWLRGNRRFRQCGALLCATDQQDAERIEQQAVNPATSDLTSWLTASEASQRAGLGVPHGAAWIPTAGTCDLAGLTRDLLEHPGITVNTEPSAEQIDLTIWATANTSSNDQVQRVRGQAIAVQWPDSHTPPKTVLCTSGYLSPPRADGVTWLGSTFDRGDDGRDHRPSDDSRILEHFAALPELAHVLANTATTDRFAGVRNASANRLPMIGLGSRDLEGPALSSVAHGSRGAVTAPWAADILARLALGEPIPLSLDYWQRLRPTRP
jgi:tRNA 5-methylaminomethyl-2-thiouridine biosynthesis bifunctional protein